MGKARNDLIKIGELAQLVGVQVVTIRYYEKEGLLDKPQRTPNGYRTYRRGDVERLRFIRHCRDHGMAIEDIKTLLKLREAPERDCMEVNTLVDEHIKKLEEQLASLQALKSRLVELRGKCPHSGAIANCGILRGLDGAHCRAWRAEEGPKNQPAP
ncbi:MAG: Cd(II)/Pb(II)-responsive transcriptional regulator [Deltaproteobacteria bacterium]|nr:Cd(II)/Pb(II)-responsive transcriptional regulator [Deltaproteobacteria bacterium]